MTMMFGRTESREGAVPTMTCMRLERQELQQEREEATVLVWVHFLAKLRHFNDTFFLIFTVFL